MTSRGDDLPNPSRVLRFVPYGRMLRDAEDNFIGPAPEAFRLRPGEEYLSVTWCEYFQGSPDEQLRCAIEAIRNSNLKVGDKACFCEINTSRAFDALATHGRVGRAVYLPEEDNKAHAGLYGVAEDDELLLSLLSEILSQNWLDKQRADRLPLSECFPSDDIQ